MTFSNKRRILLLANVAIFATMFCSASAFAQRIHSVERDGLFHVKRYHYTSDAIAIQGFNTFGQIGVAAIGILPDLVGRDGTSLNPRDVNPRGQSSMRLSDSQDYVREQQRANNLLERTEALLLGKIANVPDSGDKPKVPAGTFPKMTEQELQDAYGTDPWNDQ